MTIESDSVEADDREPVRVLFVCLGNICRSPTAEAVMRHRVSAHGLDHLIEVDSAGTGGWHAGDLPDDRARAEAARRGLTMDSRARKVHVGDLEYFDLVLAMDEANLTDLMDLATTAEQRTKVRRLREFDPASDDDLDVPDPYYGGPNGFADVFDLVDAACGGLLDHLQDASPFRSMNDLAEQVSAALRKRVLAMVEVGGGGDSTVYRLTLDGGRSIFVKTRSDSEQGMYSAEADGLRWLAETRAVRVPEVLAVKDLDGAPERRFLVLTWVDQHLPAPDFDEQLGRDLARLHKSGAPLFGLDRDNFIATIPQSNRPHSSWANFYAIERLEPLVNRAIQRHLLDDDAPLVFDRLLSRLPDLVGPSEPPARLHGDLWKGNTLAGLRGEPWLIDPAVYGGHREIDLAMMHLFGGFGPKVFAAYDEAFPLAEGQGERVALYQIYPLLVHALLFGGGYTAAVMNAARYYVV